MTDSSPPLDLSALARKTVRRVSKGNNAVRFVIDGHDETIAFSTNADAVKVWDLLRRLEAAIEAALVRVQQGMEKERIGYQMEADRILRERVEAEERLRGELEQARQWQNTAQATEAELIAVIDTERRKVQQSERYLEQARRCEHAHIRKVGRTSALYGSWPVEQCAACGLFRIGGHVPGP